jgi:hypothetical protein
MKRNFYFIIFFLFFAMGNLKAQPPRQGQGQPNVESLKIAFLTKQLELSPDEAKKFWPVHDAYQDDIEKLLRDHRDKKGDELELEEKMLAIRKKYKPDFVKAIGEEKFNKMLRAEREFRDLIRKELERRRGNMQQGKGGGMRPSPPQE